ncbi:caspase domain-containing protein [Armillaria fumosa]|nr:caspase domain-containing protein [Armillaria fumosa]
MPYTVTYTNLWRWSPDYHRSKIQPLKNMMRRLKPVELEAAQKFGLPEAKGGIGSLQVLQKAEARASATGNAEDAKTLEILEQLHQFRVCISCIRTRIATKLEPCPCDIQYGAYLSSKSSFDASRFWVVIIGIDAYDQSPLDGAFRDAKMMLQYFIEDLGVPHTRIQCLLAPCSVEKSEAANFKHPTRANIIYALYSLVNNKAIETGDNIVVYFAGHGSCYPLPDQQGSTQCLCPVDRDTIDTAGKPVLDISDRELNVILSEIRRAKGDRITVLLDCSCMKDVLSISLSDSRKSRSLPPSTTPAHKILKVSEKRLSKMFPDHPSVLAQDWHPDLTSHVIITACNDAELAWEVLWADGTTSGVFTRRLLETLRAAKATTYEDLCRTLEVHCSPQTPGAVGKNKTSLLWYRSEHDTV